MQGMFIHNFIVSLNLQNAFASFLLDLTSMPRIIIIMFVFHFSTIWPQQSIYIYIYTFFGFHSCLSIIIFCEISF